MKNRESSNSKEVDACTQCTQAGDGKEKIAASRIAFVPMGQRSNSQPVLETTTKPGKYWP